MLSQPGGGVGLGRALGFIKTPANLFLVSLTTFGAVEASWTGLLDDGGKIGKDGREDGGLLACGRWEGGFTAAGSGGGGFNGSEG